MIPWLPVSVGKHSFIHVMSNYRLPGTKLDLDLQIVSKEFDNLARII